MRYQRTIGRAVNCTGVGLHTGERARLRFVPAPPDTGIIFIRHDGGRKASVRAEASRVVSTHFSTTLGRKELSIQTVEHLLAALAGLGIDNLSIEVDGPEVPIMDGSAWPFVRLLRDARIVNQGKLQSYLKIERPLEVSDGDRLVRIAPADRFKVIYSMSFDHALFPEQTFSYIHTENNFVRDVARARTFGFLRDVERMRSAGLIKGGSLQNAVVIGESRVMNEGGLRYPDELVRHKVLDLIGDLSLLGRPLMGELTVRMAGHALHTQMVSLMMKNKDAWVLTEDTEEADASLAPSHWALAPRVS